MQRINAFDNERPVLIKIHETVFWFNSDTSEIVLRKIINGELYCGNFSMLSFGVLRKTQNILLEPGDNFNRASSFLSYYISNQGLCFEIYLPDRKMYIDLVRIFLKKMIRVPMKDTSIAYKYNVNKIKKAKRNLFKNILQ